MKKIFIFSVIALGLYACNNASNEKQEEAARDSSDQVQVSRDQAIVDSLMQADEAKDSGEAAPAATEPGHEGHDHSSHEGHSH